jgi:uncharacterized protein
MRVVLAGASGLIGSALRAALIEAGDSVTTLVRTQPAGPDEVEWSPSERRLDPAVLAGADAVVCLSGAGVGEHRWREKYKQTILASRVESVSTISQAMASHGGPAVLLTASAVGYYGDAGDRTLLESAPNGRGFLADVCRQWEAATAPAEAAGIRVAHLRTGLVLSGNGGLLKQLASIVSLGIAGRLGTGKQYMPWISLADEVAAIRFLLVNEVAGPVNLAGPEPVRNAEFMSTLGALLHRPTLLPTPKFALRIVLGEFAGDAVASQRAVPARLLDAGFRHEHAEVESALRWALQR